MDLVNAWLDASVDSLGSVAQDALGRAAPERKGSEDRLPEGLSGALIPVVHDQSLQIGFFASEKTCARLAKSLLMMGEDEEISNGDVTDALGEIVNMVAGGAKQRLAHLDNVKLGLPICIHGEIQASPNILARVAVMTFDGDEAEMLVLSHGRR